MPSATPILRSRLKSRRGFTLLEMLTVVAFLVIVMGLMVSLARYVRMTSADRLTRTLLHEVERAVDQYVRWNGRPPRVAPPGAEGGGVLTEMAFIDGARANNQQLLAQLSAPRQSRRKSKTAPVPLDGTAEPTEIDLTTLRTTTGELVRDAWGSPLIYMTAQHPLVGMAPGNRPFCFSAGPDRRYLTREDNLYSYEDRASGEKAEPQMNADARR